LEFLSLIYYADAIVTNSFHAVAFSVIFEKNFFVFMLKELKINSRMIDFLESICLSDRIVTCDDFSVECNTIEYKEINGLLFEKISESKYFLSKSLKTD